MVFQTTYLFPSILLSFEAEDCLFLFLLNDFVRVDRAWAGMMERMDEKSGYLALQDGTSFLFLGRWIKKQQ